MTVKQEFSQKEINQRIAVLKRFRELLKAQRDRFSAYLEALDKSKVTIEQGTADDLIRHVDLEEKIISDICSIQKVIDPLEKMYRELKIAGDKEDDIPSLKSALESIGKEAAARSERNRNLLSTRMAELRSEIKTLRSNPYLQKQSRQKTTAPTVVDIMG